MAPYLQCLWNSPGVHPSGHGWNREQIIWQMLRGTSFQTIAGCKINIDSPKLFRWFKKMRPFVVFWNPRKNMHKGAIHPTISFHASGSPIYIVDLIIKINEMSKQNLNWSFQPCILQVAQWQCPANTPLFKSRYFSTSSSSSPQQSLTSWKMDCSTTC